MHTRSAHTFHIPVLGLGYSVDAPVKVAHFGINSVMSIIQDDLIEKMRRLHCEKQGEKYIEISESDEDYRARRITAYLNLIQQIVAKNIETVKSAAFTAGSLIVKYFEMLPEDSEDKKLFREAVQLPAGSEIRIRLERKLREAVLAGSLDVNIMCKVDNFKYDNNGQRQGAEYSDAHAALRGFAKSNLHSSIVLSAGYNPSLYNYIGTFSDFLPDEEGELKKKIILKVSDWRSARIQATKLAQKGIWVSEFRIESGLNCGGHAFATDGLLMGPILEEFRNGIGKFSDELRSMCNAALIANGKSGQVSEENILLSAQGGFGTYAEHEFARKYYNLHSIGWGSPFLLVPEVMNIDDETLQLLNNSSKRDYYMSNSSPLGIPLNTVRNTSSAREIADRMAAGKPGSPCYHQYLASDTEFSERPLCTASRAYQRKKLQQLKESAIVDQKSRQNSEEEILAKDCLCEGLSASAYVMHGIPRFKGLKGIAVCPGPNLAYFSGIFSLQQMVDHIYGRTKLLNSEYRSFVFVNELHLYVRYYIDQIANFDQADQKSLKKAAAFLSNLLAGVNYYESILSDLPLSQNFRNTTRAELEEVRSLLLPQSVTPVH